MDLVYIYDNEEVPLYGTLFRGNPRVVVIPYADGKDVVLRAVGYNT